MILLVAILVQTIAAAVYTAFVWWRLRCWGAWVFSFMLWVMVLRRCTDYMLMREKAPEWFVDANHWLLLLISLIGCVGALLLAHDVGVHTLIARRLRVGACPKDEGDA